MIVIKTNFGQIISYLKILINHGLSVAPSIFGKNTQRLKNIPDFFVGFFFYFSPYKKRENIPRHSKECFFKVKNTQRNTLCWSWL
jgi:hypothetical protein